MLSSPPRLVLVVLASLTLAVSAVLGEGASIGVYRVSPEAREALLSLSVTVHHGRIGGDLVVELTPAQASVLGREGYSVQRIYASLDEQSRAIRGQADFEQFATYEQIRSDFYACAAAHPGIARLVVLGSSVQNRELFALRITDNPDLQEDEPELAFWGGIHGNEYGGAELPYRYALYLCNNYGADPGVTRAVDDNELWCIPLINPDGRVQGTRTNAHGVDLNRDLGYEWSGEGASSAPFSQVETRVVREFCASHNIDLSTSFHCSGDIVFYPWGYAPQNVPDHAPIVSISQAYAAAASYAHGNSWQDYETHGELLDYLYGSHGGICLTVEVSNSASLIPQTFARNLAGMNVLCARAAEGLRGMVTDSRTGLPISAAVYLSGNSIPAYTDSDRGDLHRFVAPGTYDLFVQANGYAPQIVQGVVVAQGAPGTFQVALAPGGPGAGDYAFRVVAVNQRDPNHAHANVSFPSSALGPPDNVTCSLGSAGFLVLDMGEGHEIIDSPGADFQVVEGSPPGDPNPEGYFVYTGDAYTQATLIGSGTGTAAFDLGAAGVVSARYLRVVDSSGSNPNAPLAGMDLDAVIANINAPSWIGEQADAGMSGDLRIVAFPNPCRSAAVLQFTLARTGPVTLSLFDAAGRRLGPVLRFEGMGSGRKEVRLDGSRWSAGRYFYRVQTEGGAASGSLLRIQ